MSRVNVGLGQIAFSASPSPDASAYIVYFAETAEELLADAINYDSLDSVIVDAVEGQTEYTVDVPDNQVARDGEFFFALVTRDTSGNLSDPSSPPVAVSVDVTPPLPPTNVRFVPSPA